MAASENTFRAAVVQFEPTPDAPEVNLATVERMARAAVADGARLVAFPEMCLLGYWHLTKQSTARLRELAEPVDGPSLRAVRALATGLEAGIGVGFLEHGPDDRLYNSYAVALPDGTLHVHRKLHAFEHESISSGDRYTVFDTPWGIRMGVLICWDNNLVENVRATALAGATVLIAPHQTGGTSSRSPHGMRPIPMELWEARESDPAAIEAAFRGHSGREWLLRWLPSRAHDNGIFVLFSNGVGRDDDEVRTGNSMILDPYGRIVAETWAARDDTVIADLDLDLVPLSTGQRWIRGRRPELYEPLTRRTGDELEPRAARFSDDPVRPLGEPAQG
ncbi:putative amidohydrolase [Diaminobutyricimonas aerilata]|uniref:Putative amidohydrolase n=1 Tax=Diaminobutyricimonas aerilata TaxID=1162967 RepID=A0A2M9CL74_9MICO|nr:nitrilase family protein [Diaminobutyricimonas aerilata]PJJ72640.1 putative amidohydrolase [Diaminobutyricimonas aerilata]